MLLPTDIRCLEQEWSKCSDLTYDYLGAVLRFGNSARAEEAYTYKLSVRGEPVEPRTDLTRLQVRIFWNHQGEILAALLVQDTLYHEVVKDRLEYPVIAIGSFRHRCLDLLPTLR